MINKLSLLAFTVLIIWFMFDSHYVISIFKESPYFIIYVIIVAIFYDFISSDKK